MKKLLSIVAFLALAITAHAQLSFVCDGKEIASGATFATSKCDPKILEEDGAYAFFPDVSIKSTENANVTVNARSTKSFSFCMDGNCLPGNNTTKKTDLEANIPKGLNIEPGGLYEDIVTFKYDIYAFITGKESTTKITMTLVVTNDQNVLGVNNIVADNEKVSFANGALNYSFATAAPRTISLATVSGAEVAKWNVASANGSLSLFALKPGLYVYSVSGSKAKGKIVVK
jgi:hypothetical protein